MNAPDDEPQARRVDRINQAIRRSFIRGIALTIPLIVTLFVFAFAVRSLSQAVGPFVEGVTFLFGLGGTPEFVLELFALVLLFWFVLGVGFLAERRAGEKTTVSRTVDRVVAEIPGFGSVYTGVRRLSDVLLTEDTDSFQEVKLLEFPGEGSYMLCYVTATPPATIRDVARADGGVVPAGPADVTGPADAVAEDGDATEVLTLFVPMAPNPVMGGFLVHAPRDRVHDIDMTVEESMQAIITSGVAADPMADENAA